MNVYAFLPLVATIAYIPLLVTTISSHPMQTRHKLFLAFLVPATAWSFTDYVFRTNFYPDYNPLLLKAILIIYTVMAVQFYVFISSFYSPGEGRWLPFAYTAMVAISVLLATGFIPTRVLTVGDMVYPQYGIAVVYMAIPLLVLLARSVYVFSRKLRVLDNPVLYNQKVSLLAGLAVLTVFTFAALLPWGREVPISHFGNIINAFMLSYATIRHKLVDIRFVLRRGLAWGALGFAGACCFAIILTGLQVVIGFRLDVTGLIVATVVSMVVSVFLYRMHGLFFATVTRAFQGESYSYRQRLSDFANRIHSVFSLKEQGGELLELVTKAIGCRRACLLFLDVDSGDFNARLVEPELDNPMTALVLRGRNPIIEYLRREGKPLTAENVTIMPEFLGLWSQERDEIKANEIELFMPLVSRNHLIGILVLDRKKTGRYSLDDFNMLEDVTNRVAVSIEKEYLREQLEAREEELSVINRTSAIITSSLDIQRIYDNFIQELKKIVDVSWASIMLLSENELHILALSSEIGSAWKAGERIPIKGSATEWVAEHKEPIVEPDLSQESRFTTGKYHLQQGIRSVAYLPLIVGDEVIGSLIVASRESNVYGQRHVKLLEQLASQIAMPIKNSMLYAKAEQRARIDELTGLLNRRALDEMIASEIGRHSRYGGVFSVIILDLDLFKGFNDTYGHLAGDKFLRQLGGILKGSIRSADQAFRYGGDEFAILLPQTSIDTAEQVAERVRQRVAVRGSATAVPVTASLGLSSWPADGVGASELLSAADAALYQAKRSGSNRTHCASGTLLSLDVNAGGGDGHNVNSEVLSSIYALAAAVDARDHYTSSHSRKVSEYAVAMGEALHLDALEVSRLSTCALLHDIGKIGVSDEILNKASKLNPVEWEAIKAHPRLGAATARHARHLAPCILGILHHHEKYDGSGYPKGLKGEAIPLEARILAIADAFAAMTSPRPYSGAMSRVEALGEIRQGAGTQFDPHLVEIFLSVIKDSPVDSTAAEKI